MGFSMQKYWSELPWPPPGNLPDPRIKPVSLMSPISRQVLYHCGHLGSPNVPLTFLFVSILLLSYSTEHLKRQSQCQTTEEFLFLGFCLICTLTNVLGIQQPVQSVQFSPSVVSDSLWPHESQYTRPPCPSPTPGVYSNSCPLSRWCHPAISSSVIPFSSCPQSLPASGSFSMSQLFAWGGQSTGVSALASVLPMNTQDWPLLEWTGWIPCNSLLEQAESASR